MSDQIVTQTLWNPYPEKKPTATGWYYVAVDTTEEVLMARYYTQTDYWLFMKRPFNEHVKLWASKPIRPS